MFIRRFAEAAAILGVLAAAQGAPAASAPTAEKAAKAKPAPTSAARVPAAPAPPAAPAAALALDESPARPGEWGFRPEDGRASPVNPPNFVWRPQKGADAYELECSRDAAFAAVDYRAAGLQFFCHTPPRTLAEGPWHWRFRYVDKSGRASAWSKVRAFTLDKSAAAMPMPTREELLSRIPKTHPRLFIRPEQLPRLRELAKGELKPHFDRLVADCDRLLKSPPPTQEPPKYPPDCKRLSEEWRVIWWGNREYTIRALNAAATLGFTRLLGSRQEYGPLARRILMDCAAWDPKGSTNYRYNDEAGMPYAYFFSRAYTFNYDLLSEEDRAKCREVMAVRGREMYEHLCPRHLWSPYNSHSNRAWHKLGEAGIAFYGEIPEAADWTWFAMNVFYNVYPVWCDPDGGWHEGASYWNSYMARFSYWADVMRVALGIDAYKKPYFSQAGYYAMYLQPPGTKGGGFGDLNPTRPAETNAGLMTNFAVQAANPYWQWYVEAVGGPRPEGGYIGLVRGTLPKTPARPPDDLPASRCFRGIGQAYLNTTLRSAADNVEVLFKSSPFGTQSHGYDSNNAFMLYVTGEPLFLSTGRRDLYGSEHHTRWMWHTRSTNCITVNGQSQGKRSAAAQGEVLGFYTSSTLDYVAGEAGACYGDALKRFTRHIVFAKPGLVVIFDRLEAPQPALFQWHLHAPAEMKAAGQGDIRAATGPAAARVAMLAPAGLKLSQTDKYDPPPHPRIKVTEWHLAAETAAPAPRVEFVTVIRPHRAGQEPTGGQTLKPIPGGYALEADLADGRAIILLRAADSGSLSYGGRSADADVAAVRLDKAGKPVAHLAAAGRSARGGPGEWAR